MFIGGGCLLVAILPTRGIASIILSTSGCGRDGEGGLYHASEVVTLYQDQLLKDITVVSNGFCRGRGLDTERSSTQSAR